MKKLLPIISIILMVLITFVQEYDARSVEELSYIIALGIDKSDSETEPLSLSIQIAKPDNSEGGGGTKIKTETQTINCNSFNLGMAILNLQNVNELNLSHCTAIIISEELAREGIEDFINTLSNNIEIRPTCNILISEQKASEFLEVASNIEDISAKFYNTFINSAKTVSYVTPCQLSDFYANLNYDVQDPLAVYSFVKDETIESLGLALFKDYKMLDRISGLETLCYNILTNNFDEATIEIYNSQNPSIPLAVNITKAGNAKISAKLENNVPKITCKFAVKASILSANKNYNFSSHDSLREIESEINKFLNDSISNFLYKLATKYECDPVGFEGYFNRNYLTQKELNKLDWQEIYPKSQFIIEPETYLVSGFLFSKN